MCLPSLFGVLLCSRPLASFTARGGSQGGPGAWRVAGWPMVFVCVEDLLARASRVPLRLPGPVRDPRLLQAAEPDGALPLLLPVLPRPGVVVLRGADVHPLLLAAPRASPPPPTVPLVRVPYYAEGWKTTVLPSCSPMQVHRDSPVESLGAGADYEDPANFR